MRNHASCPTCAVFEQELLQVMKEHLKAEHELYQFAFDIQDSIAAHEVNLRILQVIEKIKDLRSRFDMHRLKDHLTDEPQTVNA